MMGASPPAPWRGQQPPAQLLGILEREQLRERLITDPQHARQGRRGRGHRRSPGRCRARGRRLVRLCAVMPPSETIDTVLDAFLHEQRARLSERTYRNYEDVIRLLRDSLNTYAYSSLSATEAKRWQKAFDA